MLPAFLISPMLIDRRTMKSCTKPLLTSSVDQRCTAISNFMDWHWI